MHPSHLWRKGVLSTCRFLHSAQKCGMKTMQAWQAFEYGSPEKLQLNTMAEIPVIKSSIDVLVKVHAASVNPLDVCMLEGYGSTAFNFVRQVNNCSLTPQEFPLQLGRDFSGTIVHVGKCAKNYKVGDEISKKPSSISHAEAASFPYSALTAWSAIKIFGGLCEKSTYGKRVLVIGTTGGVGMFSVQVNPVIEKVYKFEDIPQAYEKVAKGHARGKTVIDYSLCGEEINKEESNSEPKQNV
ncbi:Reticulon-4-interacting protein 1 like protein [Argiope bruennichi]|uniref:Reticulon-4-interacting protein 1 like protein n=1 Tax=Argiope bruennichi TaxID=94029 RepID=A0A8T0EUJ1_ARGBR|nr:Reticulon-4-interacting protein 1 like protein [Argiope bruennichi]